MVIRTRRKNATQKLEPPFRPINDYDNHSSSLSESTMNQPFQQTLKLSAMCDCGFELG